MKIQQRITKEENERIYCLIEKKNALVNLKEILKDKPKEALYDECEMELQSIMDCCAKWWDEILEKYGLKSHCGEWYVDVVENIIYII